MNDTYTRYELIKPTQGIVNKYNRFWNEDKDNIQEDEWYVQLFKDDEKVDMRRYTVKDPHVSYGKNDDDIVQEYEKGSISVFLSKINSLYSTRLDVKKLENIDKDWLDNNSIDTFILECKKRTGRYAYSFATKVYSFIKPEKYPIVDSLVATMLWEYLDDGYKKEHKKSDWGDYTEYQRAYNHFKEHFGLMKYTYKEIDRFLWTYAVAIQNYWRDQGVLQFSPISYKR